MNHELCRQKRLKLFFMIGLVPNNASELLNTTKKHQIPTVRQADV
jgi:hypothetical protein